MRGYLPARSRATKNGVQSIMTSVRRSMSSSSWRPVKLGLTGVYAGPVELRLVRQRLGIAEPLGACAAVGGALADHGVLFAGLLGEGRLEFLGQQRGGDADRARGVGDVNHGVILVVRVDLHRGVRLGGGGAADHQRQAETLTLHLAGDVDHLVERRGDEAGEADDVALLGDGGLQDLFRRHHHAHVDHVIAVAAEHHADDVLADVVHVALHGGHEEPALGFRLVAFLRFDEGDQVHHGLLHHPGGLDHLRQEHLAGAEQVADHVHAGHQRTFDDFDRPCALLTALLGVFDDVGGDALDQRVLQPLAHRQVAPFFGLGFLHGAAALVLLASSSSASVPLALRLSTTSSTASRSSLGISS
ncbi:hypothetical protein SSTU70S_03922 [Stutzerimonas stutzeri]